MKIKFLSLFLLLFSFGLQAGEAEPDFSNLDPHLTVDITNPNIKAVAAELFDNFQHDAAPASGATISASALGGKNMVTLKALYQQPKLACDYPGCGYRADHTSTLTKHQRTHTREKPFTCPHCEYRAARNSHLEKHMQVHNKTKKQRGYNEN